MYSSLKPKLLFVLEYYTWEPQISFETCSPMSNLVPDAVHIQLNYVSSLQASETGSNVTWLELSIRTFRTKNKTMLFPENSIPAIFLTSIIQVLLEHSSSHKAYATVTIFICVQSGYLLKKNLFVHKGQFFLPSNW